MDGIINCHAHVFNSRHVPNGFLPLGLTHLLRTRMGAAALRGLNRFLRRPWMDRLAVLFDVGNAPTQRAILDFLLASYPVDSRFVLLPMDMDFMGAGQAPRPYLEQLAELAALKCDHPATGRLLPFVAVDPRRPGLLGLVREFIEERGFAGLKVYPPLGFWPSDERLAPVLEYVEARGLPVITHCSRGGIHYKGRLTGEMRRHPDTGELLPQRRNSVFTDHFSHPDNWRRVLTRFPRLRLCLAHWGGDDEWHRHLDEPWPGSSRSWLSACSELAREFENAFVDVSYTAHERRFHPLLRVLMGDPTLRDKVLYGSDYYMLRRELSEREFSLGVRALLGDEGYRRIAVSNPARFLF